tara:strand:+ start:464 stop:733 length:270 start_codon:yes stop_codon:yes gene_type:complete
MAGWVEVGYGGPRWGVVCFVRATQVRLLKMSKTKAEESRELDDQVAEFLERGGEVQQIDTREAKLKDMMVSNRFFAKTNYLMFKSHKER